MPTWITKENKAYFELVDNYKEDLSSCTVFELPKITITAKWIPRYKKILSKLNNILFSTTANDK